jgi:prepilin peptidase CpaA
MEHVQWIMALGVVSWAAWTDWRSRKIPNRLTLPALVLGVALNTILGGLQGTLVALGGAALMLVLLLPLVWLRALGAGDWKLMGALGAFLGPRQIFVVFLATTFLAGLLAAIQVVRADRVKTTLSNLWELIRGLFVYGMVPHPEIRLDNPKQLSLPYGVAAAGATAACYLVGLFLISL